MINFWLLSNTSSPASSVSLSSLSSSSESSKFLLLLKNLLIASFVLSDSFTFLVVLLIRGDLSFLFRETLFHSSLFLSSSSSTSSTLFTLLFKNFSLIFFSVSLSLYFLRAMVSIGGRVSSLSNCSIGFTVYGFILVLSDSLYFRRTVKSFLPGLTENFRSGSVALFCSLSLDSISVFRFFACNGM